MRHQIFLPQFRRVLHAVQRNERGHWWAGRRGGHGPAGPGDDHSDDDCDDNDDDSPAHAVDVWLPEQLIAAVTHTVQLRELGPKVGY